MLSKLKGALIIFRVDFISNGYSCDFLHIFSFLIKTHIRTTFRINYSQPRQTISVRYVTVKRRSAGEEATPRVTVILEILSVFLSVLVFVRVAARRPLTYLSPLKGAAPPTQRAASLHYKANHRGPNTSQWLGL